MERASRWSVLGGGVGLMLLALSWTELAGATTRIPYPATVRRAIEANFLEAGTASPEKVAVARDRLERKREFVARSIYDSRRVERGEKKKKARRKAEEHDLVFALDHALELLDRLAVANDEALAYQLGAEILTLDFATRRYAYALGSIQTPIYLRNMISPWRVDGRVRPGSGIREASNLVDPASGEFYTPEELDALIAAGSDLSRLDPPGDGLLWRPVPDISSVDVVARYLGGGDAMHGGLASEFPPDGATLELKKLRLTQTKPKLDAWWLDETCRAQKKAKRKDCRRLYKLRAGPEMHSDPVVNALMAALGFNVDVSLHARNVRVNLGDTSLDEVTRDWSNYFDRQLLWTRLPLDRALLPGGQGRGEDADGEYLVFRAVGVESKPAEIRRIGEWSNGLVDPASVATGMREARGLAIFDAWVANTDTKDAGNNKLVLRADGAGRLRLFMNLQDAGMSLGLILPEKADGFPWDVVEQGRVSSARAALGGRIPLNYAPNQDTALSEIPTFADQRWMVRLIAQLRREQIEAAVGLGRFPGGVGPLYVEKLIHRRNQLVDAFGLSDEFAPMPVDRALTTADGTVVEGELVVGRFPDLTPTDLGEHGSSLLRPIGEELWRNLRRLVAVGIGGISSIGAEADVGDVVLYPDVLVQLRRDIAPNPEPEGALDQYIVEDSFTIGVSLGVGYYGEVRGMRRRRYRLAYTAPSEWKAKLHGNQALNWFLPRDARRGELPERYVLLRSDDYGLGLGARSPDPADTVTAGGDGGVDWIRDRRVTIEKRPGESAVWLEEGDAVQGAAQLWFKFYPIRFTFWRAELERGRKQGKVYLLEDGPGTEAALDALRDGDPEPVRTLGSDTARQTDVRYDHGWRGWGVIVAAGEKRVRREEIELHDARGRPLARRFQSAERADFRWSVLDNGEAYACDVVGHLNPEKGGAEVDWAESDPVVVASYLVDDRNAHSDELDRYHGFLLGLGGGKPYLARSFVATDWEQTGRPDGRWGRLLVEGQVVLRREALDALLEIDSDALWHTIASRAGLSRNKLDRVRRVLTDPTAAIRERTRTPGRLRRQLAPLEAGLRLLRAARAARAPRERLAHLTRAVARSSCFRGTRTREALSVMLDQIDFPAFAKRKQGSVRARIGSPVDRENKLPAGRDFVGQIGKRHLEDQPYVVTEPFDPIELYNMLDWARGEPRTQIIAPETLR